MTVTIKDLRDRAESSPLTKLRFTLQMWDFEKPSYSEWVSLVESSISIQVSELGKHRNHFQGSGEDAITSTIVIGLVNLGLTAQSAMVNGNCDVVISYRDYMWLGEAKIFTGVTVVWGGYLQLTQRYATAMPNQNSGGMLLYCFKDSASDLLAEWRAALSAGIADSNSRDNSLPLTFRSTDIAKSSGLSIEILHYTFPLLHEPQEDILKLPASALAAGKVAKREAKREAKKGL